MKTLAQVKWIAGTLVIAIWASAKEPQPAAAFWQKNPATLNKIMKHRSVPVVVEVTSTSNAHQQQMKMDGAGLINAPQNFASQWILNFSNLKRVSSYVREVRWNPKTKLLFLHTAAFGYHARMHIQMISEVKDRHTLVNWTVKKGFLEGLQGQLKSEEKGFGKTLFSVQADDDFKKAPIPKIFVEFGFEVVVQKFAENVRSLVESDFKKGR